MHKERETHFPFHRLPGAMIVVTSIAIALLLSTGCRSTPEEAYIRRQAIFGTWHSSANGWFLKIHSDGRVEIDRRDGEPAIRGHLSRGGDQVNIRYLARSDDCGSTPGLYRFRREGDQLLFEMIADECINRRQFLEGGFTRITVEERSSPRGVGE